MERFVVYQITNTVNGKRYIGYTSKTVCERWKGHLKDARLGSTVHFHNAIRKYGEDAFVSEVLYKNNTSKDAKETEILMILDRSPEYNKTYGGDGTHGHPVTDETRLKIRQNTPVKFGKDHPLFGVKRPDIVRMNENRKGIKNPNQARKGEKNPNWGKSRPKVITAMRAALPEVTSLETRAKQSASAKLRATTEEGQKNSSLAGKKGAAVRWERERALKAVLAQGTSSPT